MIYWTQVTAFYRMIREMMSATHPRRDPVPIPRRLVWGCHIGISHGYAHINARWAGSFETLRLVQY